MFNKICNNCNVCNVCNLMQGYCFRLNFIVVTEIILSKMVFENLKNCTGLDFHSGQWIKATKSLCSRAKHSHVHTTLDTQQPQNTQDNHSTDHDHDNNNHHKHSNSTHTHIHNHNHHHIHSHSRSHMNITQCSIHLCGEGLIIGIPPGSLPLPP